MPQAHPWVPRLALTWQMPRLVAKMTMGARLDSSARLRNVKHSMSSMCTCVAATTCQAEESTLGSGLRWC